MQAALHQHAGPAQFDGLANLVVNSFEIEDVSLFRLRPFQRPIEGAEGAVLGAVIRVINIAINDVGGHALGMKLAAHRVRFHADANQVIGTKQVESLLFGERHVRSTA